MAQKSNPVLLVGAYERENFGDLLFLLQTRPWLEGVELLATAPFAGAMTRTLGFDIPAYAPLLRQGPVPAVWVVGGEVGGTTVADAYRMSAGLSANDGAALEQRTQAQPLVSPGGNDFGAYSALDRKERIRHLEKVSGLNVAASPYLPRMSASPATFGATLVINSVGLSAMRRLIGDRADETWGAIREASYVSVRDRASSDLLTRRGLSHTLAPDLVQGIVRTRPRSRPRDLDLALVQVKAKVLDEFGIEKLAQILMSSRALSGFRIRFFSAGPARGHDSIELYDELAKVCLALAPERIVDVSTSLLPFEKVDEIAHCGLFIGTSLHGLIISSAYDVPRVGLELDKLVQYARSWGETMPVGVPMGDIDAAVSTALAEATKSAASGRSLELAELAKSSAAEAARIVRETTGALGLSDERARTAKRLERKRTSLSRRAIRQALRFR
jgi:hypothetical protein